MAVEAQRARPVGSRDGGRQSRAYIGVQVKERRDEIDLILKCITNGSTGAAAEVTGSSEETHLHMFLTYSTDTLLAVPHTSLKPKMFAFSPHSFTGSVLRGSALKPQAS